MENSVDPFLFLQDECEDTYRICCTSLLVFVSLQFLFQLWKASRRIIAGDEWEEWCCSKGKGSPNLKAKRTWGQPTVSLQIFVNIAQCFLIAGLNQDIVRCRKSLLNFLNHTRVKRIKCPNDDFDKLINIQTFSTAMERCVHMRIPDRLQPYLWRYYLSFDSC